MNSSAGHGATDASADTIVSSVATFLEAGTGKGPQILKVSAVTVQVFEILQGKGDAGQIAGWDRVRYVSA